MLLRVLALDDDPAQRHVLNAALHNVAWLDFFTDPAAAAQAVSATAYDAAIVDVHLRRSREDGFQFARGVQQVDPALGILLYTGDDSHEVLESALEIRAMRRLLKASGNHSIVSSVQACAEETQRNRRLHQNAASGAEARQQLQEQVTTIEISRTLADLYRGFFHGLCNDLTAAGVTSAALSSLADQSVNGEPGSAAHKRTLTELRRTAEANAGIISRLGLTVAQTAGEGTSLTGLQEKTLLGPALQALKVILSTDPRLAAGGMTLTVPERELVVPMAQMEFLNGLRNTAMFLLDHATGSASLLITCSVEPSSAAIALANDPPPLLLLNRRSLVQPSFIHLRCCCPTARVAVEEIQAGLAEPPAPGRLFPLSRLAASLSGAIAFRQAKAGAIIDLFLPTWS